MLFTMDTLSSPEVFRAAINTLGGAAKAGEKLRINRRTIERMRNAQTPIGEGIRADILAMLEQEG